MATEGKKRQTVAKVRLVNGAGAEVKETANATGFTFAFVNGPTRVFDMGKVNDAIKLEFAFHGAKQKIRDAYAGKSGDEAVEACDTVIDNLYEGVWLGEREGGVRIGLLLDAVVAFLETDKKQSVTDERRAGIKEKLLTEEGREKAKADPKVMAHLRRLELEKAKERAAEAAKAAKGSNGETDSGDAW